MHQSWPKFVQNLFYATTDNGIAALVYAPAKVEALVADGKVVQITEDTTYPFNEKVTFNIDFAKKSVKSASFPIELCIPGWCKDAEITVNGEVINTDKGAGSIVKINRTWNRGDVLIVKLPMEVIVSRWFDGSAVVERGPLVYALKLNENWQKKYFEGSYAEKYGPWYYEVTTSDKWNFGLPRKTVEHPGKEIEVIRSATIADYPWNVASAPITLKTKGLPIKNWTISRGQVGAIGYFTQQGQDYDAPQTIELIPYGCTTLRIAEFPVR
jgi:hypothetical protein